MFAGMTWGCSSDNNSCVSQLFSRLGFLFSLLHFSFFRLCQTPASHRPPSLAFPFLHDGCLDHCHGICLLPCFAPGQLLSPATPASSQHGSSKDSRPSPLWPAGIVFTVGHVLCVYFSMAATLNVSQIILGCLFCSLRSHCILTHKHLMHISQTLLKVEKN